MKKLFSSITIVILHFSLFILHVQATSLGQTDVTVTVEEGPLAKQKDNGNKSQKITNEHPYSNKSNVQKLGSQKNSLPQTGEERCLTFVWGSILIVSASLLMKNKKRKKE